MKNSSVCVQTPIDFSRKALHLTSTPIFCESKNEENILDRLRRLSNTPEREYVPSEGAKKLRAEMDEKFERNRNKNLNAFDQKFNRPEFSNNNWRTGKNYQRNYDDNHSVSSKFVNPRRNNWDSEDNFEQFDRRRNNRYNNSRDNFNSG